MRTKVRGTSAVPRLSVFRSLSHIYAQVIDDERGHTVASASSKEEEVMKAATGVNSAVKEPAEDEPKGRAKQAAEGTTKAKQTVKGEAKGKAKQAEESETKGEAKPKQAAESEAKGKVKQAALVGSILARRAKDAGVSQVVFDRGGFRYHGRVKALAEAARKAGLKF